MDPIQIIITVAACIGGLLVLGFLIWLIAAFAVIRSARKTFRDIDESIDRDFPRRR